VPTSGARAQAALNRARCSVDRFEISAEVFNALMAKNFPASVTPGSGGNTFRITTTQSNARTAQLVFRVSW
jgi:hypothetical protein